MRLGVRLIRLAAPLAAAGLLAGCFQPLYGEHTVGGGPSIKAAMGSVDVSQIPAPNGTPESPAATSAGSSGTWPSSGTSAPTAWVSRSATWRPPPSPNTCIVVPSGNSSPDMFSTTPTRR